MGALRLSIGSLRDVFRIDSERLRSFYRGYAYPVIVAVIVVFGYISGLEFYTNLINVGMFCLGLWVCDTSRPIIIFSSTLIYQISRQNSPGLPNFSHYYFTPFKLAVLIALALCIIACVVKFIVSNRLAFDINRSTPLLSGLLAFSLGFALNGVFGSGWSFAGLAYGLIQGVTFSFMFLIYYLGFKNEKREELASYFAFVSSLIALVLVVETAYIYAVGGIVVDGEIVKEKVLYGWGIWNTAGLCLSVLIPSCFLGVALGKRVLYYYAVAALSLVAVLMTLSRNALLFGTAAFGISAVVCCFFGRGKRVSRIIVAIGAVAVAVAAVIGWDKISVLLADLFERGFSDNGRYEIWQMALENFKSAPVFGNGFYSLDTGAFDTNKFLPKLCHQTLFQLLSATGVFGTLAYGYYRSVSLVPLFKRPSVYKTLVYMSVAVLLLESLLDNGIFLFHPILYYSAALAVAFRLHGAEKEKAETRG